MYIAPPGQTGVAAGVDVGAAVAAGAAHDPWCMKAFLPVTKVPVCLLFRWQPLLLCTSQ